MKESILRNHKKNYDEAISVCQNMLKIDPNNVIALSTLSESYYRTANYEKSIEMAKQCIKMVPSQLAPSDPRYHGTLTWARSFLSLSEEELRKKLKIRLRFLSKATSIYSV
jgi:tetratricopeptide (TPR) repeat protein